MGTATTVKTVTENLTDILERDGIPYETCAGRVIVMNRYERIECWDNGMQTLKIKFYIDKDGTWDSNRIMTGNVRKAVTVISYMWNKGIEHDWTYPV